MGFVVSKAAESNPAILSDQLSHVRKCESAPPGYIEYSVIVFEAVTKGSEVKTIQSDKKIQKDS